MFTHSLPSRSCSSTPEIQNILICDIKIQSLCTPKIAKPKSTLSTLTIFRMGKATNNISNNSTTTIFNKYEMGRVLGKGTFAKVYYARELNSNNSVAIKVLNKNQVLKTPNMADQILHEISAMHLMHHHPNVVALHEVMATKSHIYLVMDYLRGGELFSKVSAGRLPETEALKYFFQLLSAIQHCHSLGVAHRDIKPENLLLDHNGVLKVSDFGLSALPEQRRQDGMLYTRCGSPAYVAPEVLRCKGYDGAKADLWSCGVVFYALLAGFLPFQDENLMRMYVKIFKGEYRTPPWFSIEAREIISGLLLVDPDKRMSIDEIKKVCLSKMGCCGPISGPKVVEDEKGEKEGVMMRCYNAFELISALSSGLDLSGLFEKRGRTRMVFTSRAGAKAIVERLESVGRELGIRTWRKGSIVTMEGRVVVEAEVVEVAKEVVVVEFSKKSGDTMEFVKFCEDIRPRLEYIVWTWQSKEDSDC